MPSERTDDTTATTSRDEPTQHRSDGEGSALPNLDALLDVFVYAPIGFVLDATDLVPQLAERGRSQVQLLRTLGRFLVLKGQREADQTIAKHNTKQATPAPAAAAPAAPPTTLPTTAPPTTAPSAVTVAPRAEPPVPPRTAAATRSDSAAKPGPARAPRKAPAPASPTATKAAAARPAKSAAKAPAKSAAKRTSTAPGATPARRRRVGLPIAGYDALSASQVVPRLAALRPDELDAVRVHELANRRRTTILNRIEQLARMTEQARPALPADHELLARFAADAVAERAGERGASWWVELERHAPDLDRDLVAVGTLDDVPVGFASMHIVPSAEGDLAWIDELYVEPDARDVSVGEVLMCWVLDTARARGCVAVEGHVLPGVRNAKNFFERFGLVARLITVHRSLADDR